MKISKHLIVLPAASRKGEITSVVSIKFTDIRQDFPSCLPDWSYTVLQITQGPLLT